MIKILKLLLSFLKELIFDSKAEHTLTHHMFNPRKFTVLMILVISIATNALLAERLLAVIQANISMAKTIASVEAVPCECEPGKK